MKLFELLTVVSELGLVILVGNLVMWGLDVALTRVAARVNLPDLNRLTGWVEAIQARQGATERESWRAASKKYEDNRMDK